PQAPRAPAPGTATRSTGAPGAGAGGEPIDVRDVRRRIQHLMSRRASIRRTADGLHQGLTELAALTARPWDARDTGPEFLAETENIALVAEMILAACAVRTESRGPHLTFDPPDAATPLPRLDPEWQRYLVICRGGGDRPTIEPQRPIQPDWRSVGPPSV
ncbi:MAG: hypothetical protein IMZ66_04340, partial [Planctomycetes bacterium]|nr:hypothetical protein [Planctomycetota bacterium]